LCFETSKEMKAILKSTIFEASNIFINDGSTTCARVYFPVFVNTLTVTKLHYGVSSTVEIILQLIVSMWRERYLLQL
jgi:hypothetical protein